MKKQSIVKGVWPVLNPDQTQKTFSTQNGTFFVFGVHFENGDTGEFNTKNPDPGHVRFKVGQQADYEIQSNPPYADKVKYVSDFQQGGGPGKGRNDALIVRQVAIKAAVEFYAQRQAATIDKVLEMAEALNDWINKKPEQSQEQPQTPQAPPPELIYQDEGEKLPF